MLPEYSADTFTELSSDQLSNLPREARQEYMNQLEYHTTMSSRAKEQAEFQRRIDAQTEVALRQNPQYQALRRGETGAVRAQIQHGVYTQENLNQPIGSLANGDFFAPAELIDTLNIRIAGVPLGPKQAREMLENGTIDPDAYFDAVQTALIPYGYSKVNRRSFR